jgi:hypothetical protein
MACITPEGKLSPTGRQLLEVLGPSTTSASHTVEELTAALDAPLYKIRASLREAAAAGLVTEDTDGIRRTTSADEMLKVK